MGINHQNQDRINETEKMKTIQELMKQKAGSFENINKTDKFLAKLIKKKKTAKPN